jgi:uncharacterized protein (TIRG00374 family)
MNRFKPSSIRIFCLFITLFIFYIIFKKLEFQEVMSVLFNASPSYLFLSFLLMVVQLPIPARRWQRILKSLGHEIPFVTCFRLFMASIPVSSITPLKSGDALRAVYLRDYVPMSENLGTLLTERLMDLLLLSLLAFAGLLLYRPYLAYIAGLLVLGIICIMVVLSSRNVKDRLKGIIPLSLRNQSVTDRIGNLTLASGELVKNKRLFLSTIWYTLLFWTLSFIQTKILFYAVGVSVPFWTVVTYIPVAILIGLLPVTISGMGTRDVAIMLLFSAYGEAPRLLGAGILFLVYRYWLISLLGSPFLYLTGTGSSGLKNKQDLQQTRPEKPA